MGDTYTQLRGQIFFLVTIVINQPFSDSFTTWVTLSYFGDSPDWLNSECSQCIFLNTEMEFLDAVFA